MGEWSINVIIIIVVIITTIIIIVIVIIIIIIIIVIIIIIIIFIITPTKIVWSMVYLPVVKLKHREQIYCSTSNNTLKHCLVGVGLIFFLNAIEPR